MTGTHNTASGVEALRDNTIGTHNTASGVEALRDNTTGTDNTASGSSALANNTFGGGNTASGRFALFFNTAGFNNTASGLQALYNNTATDNTASGSFALLSNTTGGSNTAIGRSALQNNTIGIGNIAIGKDAGLNLTTGNANIAIGNTGVAAGASTIRIGNVLDHTRAFIAGIRGVTTANANGLTVLVDSTGQLGTVSSSRRVKDDIADMGEASSTLMKLRPVTFHYKTDRNPEGRTLQYGLVAEEVAAVAPRLVARSADGEIETVYYQFLAPMLLNEYQKQQRMIEAQALEIAELKQQAARTAALLGRLERAGTITAAARR
jgi:hypothetical protein